MIEVLEAERPQNPVRSLSYIVHPFTVLERGRCVDSTVFHGLFLVEKCSTDFVVELGVAETGVYDGAFVS